MVMSLRVVEAAERLDTTVAIVRYLIRSGELSDPPTDVAVDEWLTGNRNRIGSGELAHLASRATVSVTTSVRPEVRDRINTAAAQSGLSRSVWIRQLILERLDSQPSTPAE
jgi:hypothetical protein